MIIVSGATGFVGRYLVAHLAKCGVNVIALGRGHRYDNFFASLKVKYISFDVTNEASYDLLPKYGVKAFVHLAAIIPSKMTDSEHSKLFVTNTIGTLNALNFCRKYSVRKFLLSTTLYEAIEHKSLPISEFMGRSYSLVGDHAIYVLSKIAASDCVLHYSQEYGIDGIVLRFTGLLGYGRQEGFWANGVFYNSAFEVFYRNSKAGLPLEVWGAHSARRDSLYVKDAVSAISCALGKERATGIYCIGSGVGRTNEDDAKSFVKVFSTPSRRLDIVYRPDLAEKSKSYVFDINKAQVELGWSPRFNFESLLTDYDYEASAEMFKAL